MTSQDVAISLQTYLSGLETTEFREDDKIIPVTLRSVDTQRNDINRIESLNVYSQSTGQSVPLAQVADVHVEWQPALIHRRDRLKTVTVESALRQQGEALEEAAAHDIRPLQQYPGDGRVDDNCAINLTALEFR